MAFFLPKCNATQPHGLLNHGLLHEKRGTFLSLFFCCEFAIESQKLFFICFMIEFNHGANGTQFADAEELAIRPLHLHSNRNLGS